jgi:hypothetical protein
MNKEIQLNIPYNPVVIQSKGWDENTLSIYAWDDAVGKWIKIGGTVDTVRHCVVAEVNFLSRRYVVLGSKDHKGKVIYDVIVNNNPFTPYGPASGMDLFKVDFALDKTYDSLAVNIYNLNGELVKSFKPSGQNRQASFVWDGKDRDGYMCKAGVYIYQIRAGSEKFSGTVLLLK